MNESSSNQEGVLTILANNEEILLNPERFKVRMTRLLRVLDRFRFEFRRLQQYGRDQWRDRGEWQ